MIATLEVHQECCSVGAEETLAQGDVFIWLGWAPGKDPLLRHGLVVTADCDLSHEKHGGILSYIPILALRDYLRLFLLPSQLKKALVKHDRDLLSFVSDAFSAKNPGSVPMAAEAILDWADHSTPHQIAEELGLMEPKLRMRIAKWYECRRRAVSALESSEYDCLVQSVAQLRNREASEKDIAASIAKAKKEIAQSVERLPGDAFFLSSLGDVPSDGHVAHLRLIRELPAHALATRASEARDITRRAMRIGRLKAPYLYALTQQLGTVFASIGLPESYELARSRHAAALHIEQEDS